MQQDRLFESVSRPNTHQRYFDDGRTMFSGEPPTDNLIMEQLGAAVVLCWHQLPLAVREQILSQADDMIPHMADIRTRVQKLILRHAPRR
jgi:hypothetical protein